MLDFVVLAIRPADAVAIRRLLLKAEQEGDEDAEVWKSVGRDLDVALRFNRLGEFSEGE